MKTCSVSSWKNTGTKPKTPQMALLGNVSGQTLGRVFLGGELVQAFCKTGAERIGDDRMLLSASTGSRLKEVWFTSAPCRVSQSPADE